MISTLANIKTKYLTFQTPLVWRNIIGIFALQVITVYSVIYLLPRSNLSSFLFIYVYGFMGGVGITVGAHRLWTHRTYKAKLPLRIVLIIFYLSAGMYPLVQWARDHRLHHKFTDTEADPHNANRGFFYSHCGWLMMKRTAESKEKGKLIDVSDLWEDPVVAFQQKYFVPLLIFFHIILPAGIGRYLIGDELLIEILFGFVVSRYCFTLHATWTVNSVAHLYGYKPYNKSIMAVQTKAIAFMTMGEGWHNYHHVFPWDYRIGEYGQGFQVGAVIIEFLAKLGLAYDLKAASPEMIKKVLMKADKLKQGFEHPETEISDTTEIDSTSELKEESVTNSHSERIDQKIK